MKQFETIELPTDRRFGLFFSGIFALLAFYLATTGKPAETAATASLAMLVAALALLRPAVLTPLNRAWMTLGMALGMIVSPIVLAILFFGIFTPIALVMRLLGRDELRLRRLPAGESYWRVRQPAGPPPGSFRRQY